MEQKQNKPDVTILINGCDKYEDAWEPFIKLFRIQWQDCPYPFVLNTDTKTYRGAYAEEVTSIHPDNPNVPWGRRLYGCLEKIETEYVLFIVEDYFIQNPVCVEVFEHAHSLMRADSRIGMAALSYGKPNVESGEFEDEYFFSRVIDQKNMIWCRINLYRKDYLQKLIRNHETIWEFERFASYRAQKLPYIIIQQKRSVPECFTFDIKVEKGYGITRGKWLPKNVELFEKHGIDVDFEKLGIWKEETPGKPAVQKGPVRETLYLLKIRDKKRHRTMIKRMREKKSKQ